MSKYSDIVALLDYLDRKGDKPKKRYYRRDREEEDPFKSLIRMKRMADEFQKFSSDLEKINKKEAKKEEGWATYTFIQKFTIMATLVPFVIIIEFVLPAILISHLLR